MALRTLAQADLHEKRVLLRLDLNVPIKDGRITDESRITASLPTLQALLKEKARIIVLTHLGRPDGKVCEDLRSALLQPALEKALGQKIQVSQDCIGSEAQKAAEALQAGEILLLENTRFYSEEEANDTEFARALAALGDVYVNDAFGAIHRAHASTEGVAHFLPSYAGLLLEKEVTHLSRAMQGAEAPVCLIVGGAKIDTKIGILENFVDKADTFLIGGGLANTFLAAEGYNIGASLFQADKIAVAQDFLLEAESKREFVYLPLDVRVADEVKDGVPALNLALEDVEGEMKILDLGAKSIEVFCKAIAEAKTIIWNGPMGLYELSAFSEGTRAIAHAIAARKGSALTLLGGGDTLDAIKAFGLDEQDFTHLSTGGGAMLEYLEGKELPGLKPLIEA